MKGNYNIYVEEEEEDEITEPVSPMGQYVNSKVLNFSIIAVLETEVPIDDSNAITLLEHVFLPINPRFSSLMVEEKNGDKKWKRTKVILENHIHTPTFPKVENPPYLYDHHLHNYLSSITYSHFKEDQPLWEIHIIKYPTTTCASHLLFKLHHSLGDGYSLMGALLSCFQRADNPSLPLTFPSLKSNVEHKKEGGVARFVKCVPRVFGGLYNTLCDFGWDIWKSNIMKDDISPIRSGAHGVEFNPMVITTITFSLERIKYIKSKLKVTINDVITGIIFYGSRLYMEQTNFQSRKAHSTALVLLNTRNMSGYKSVSEMVNPSNSRLWGNKFAFLNLSIPKISDGTTPLKFVQKVHKLVKRKKTSAGVLLTGHLLETTRKLRGPEVTAKYIHNTMKNSSLVLTNMIGPVDKMALYGHPIKKFYFYAAGAPQSILITMISYAGMLNIALTTEKDFVDSEKFKSCIEDALDIMLKAVSE